MQERLEKWRKNVQQIKSAEKIRGPSPLNRRNVRGDYGDEITESKEK